MDQISFQMDIGAEKLNIIHKLLMVEDELLLSAIKNILEFGLKKQGIVADKSCDFWNELSDAQKEKVEKAIQQLDEGLGLPHTEVMAHLSAFIPTCPYSQKRKK